MPLAVLPSIPHIALLISFQLAHLNRSLSLSKHRLDNSVWMQFFDLLGPLTSSFKPFYMASNGGPSHVDKVIFTHTSLEGDTGFGHSCAHVLKYQVSE